jgi:urease accessory protein
MHSSETPLHLATAPLGNLAAYDVGERVLERIVIASDDLAKRVLRLRTSRGDIGLRLAAGRQGADGDVLYADDSLVIALDVAPDDVLVCRPRTIAQALGIAHALGNRHLPVQIDGDTLVVRYDRLIEDLFAASDVAYARECRKLGAPFRHAHAPHGHA